MGWEFNNLVVVTGAIGVALGCFISWLCAKRHLIEAKVLAEKQSREDSERALLDYKSSPEWTTLLDLRFRDGYEAGSTEALNQYKKSAGYEALFSVEYSKGRAAGIDEERERWQLSYTPIVINDDGYFSSTVETGYEMQIFYSGFPISDPLRRVTSSHKKSKDDKIDKFLDIATKAVELATAITTKNKIPISINKPQTEKKQEKSSK